MSRHPREDALRRPMLRRIGILEFTPEFARLACAAVRSLGHDARRFASAHALQAVAARDLDALLVEYQPTADAPFAGLRRRGWPVVAVSSASGEQPAVAALRHGADHYLPLADLARLGDVLEEAFSSRSALQHAEAALVELRQLEAQLRQSQKMEAVGRLAAGVAHDFNNLLTIISGYAELVMGGGSLLEGGELPEFMSVSLQQILKAGEQAAGLTRQLLAFSRKEAPATVTLEPNALVVNLERMLRRLMGEEVELRSILGKDVGYVHADPGQLEQVLLNLVVNSRDAILDPACRPDSAQGILSRPVVGRVTITTGVVEVRPDDSNPPPQAKAGRFVRFSVQDTGCGMSEEVKARLFEPFFTTKPEGKGSGLGLATVYSIVQQSGGWIAVDSTLRKGTTVHVHLPLFEGPLPDIAAANQYETLSGRESVLLVEDEAEVRRLAGEALRVHGYEVHEACSAPEALDRLVKRSLMSGKPIDLVLTDVVLPGVSGRRLADEVARLWPFVPVVYMSGYTEECVLRHGVKTATVHYLQKPFTPLALVRKIRGVLDLLPARPKPAFILAGDQRVEARS